MLDENLHRKTMWGGVRPLTVGHDDNVFLNGMAQQAIQREIARLKVLPHNVYSYQKGKGVQMQQSLIVLLKK
jgi:hypothetical protein